LVGPGQEIFGSVHVLYLFVHCFLKLSQSDISENWRLLARLDLSAQIEAEQQDDKQTYE